MEKKQYIIPYLMSSHPGSTLECAIELAEYLRDINYQPEQVQDFYPTPGTLATTMYYTGLDPMTMKEVYVPKTKHEKAMQRALLQYKNPKYYTLVYEALTQAGRTDLIGNGPKCLIKDKNKSVKGYNSNVSRGNESQGINRKKTSDRLKDNRISDRREKGKKTKEKNLSNGKKRTAKKR
ncbi:hypothetical protein DFN07_001699 [Clostridium beijerinckii]|nr:hypothetical protein [Clostridium beijerinckii]